MSADPHDSPGEPINHLTGVVAAVLDEGAKSFPISAEAASGQIEAALRLHHPPGRDIFVMIAGIALAAAASIERGSAGPAQP